MEQNKKTFMAKKPEIMTTTGGNPVADNQNTITHAISEYSKAVSL